VTDEPLDEAIRDYVPSAEHAMTTVWCFRCGAPIEVEPRAEDMKFHVGGRVRVAFEAVIVAHECKPQDANCTRRGGDEHGRTVIPGIKTNRDAP
jgi:hypothetical protein